MKPKPTAILVVPLAVAVVLALFAWPSARLEPRDLPVGVVGPAPAGLADRGFEIHRYATEADAREAIDDREVYGALVPARRRVLTASAASPAVAQLLGHAAERSGARTVDVVPAGTAGSALPSSVLPLLLAGILTGALAALSATSALGRAALVAGGSLLGGLVATGIVQGWLGVVDGHAAANCTALTLTILAIAAFLAGLYALFGRHGIVPGALALVLIGNPFSAVGSAPELLPQPVGAIGQLMPPGAGANMLRSTGFFDNAAAGGHAAVLLAWAAVGFVLLAAAHMLRRSTATAGQHSTATGRSSTGTRASAPSSSA
ncbi:MAG TPA: hypothetical protein VGF21_07365 [Thermoleophilaceae bacterium]|jgi:hypothetical protein